MPNFLRRNDKQQIEAISLTGGVVDEVLEVIDTPAGGDELRRLDIEVSCLASRNNAASFLTGHTDLLMGPTIHGWLVEEEARYASGPFTITLRGDEVAKHDSYPLACQDAADRRERGFRVEVVSAAGDALAYFGDEIIEYRRGEDGKVRQVLLPHTARLGVRPT